mgnify:CR=1 FL=1
MRELVGDGADELVFHLFRLFEALGHPVDGAAQAVHLIPLVAGDGQTDVQLTPGDAGGGALHLSQRHHDAPHEVQARHDGKGQHRRTHDEATTTVRLSCSSTSVRLVTRRMAATSSAA